jgi:hypothetical protein
VLSLAAICQATEANVTRRRANNGQVIATSSALSDETRIRLRRRHPRPRRYIGQARLPRDPRRAGPDRDIVMVFQSYARRVQRAADMLELGPLFLMDEPLSNLDAKLRVQMRAEIAQVQHDLNVTTGRARRTSGAQAVRGSRGFFDPRYRRRDPRLTVGCLVGGTDVGEVGRIDAQQLG